MKSALWFCILLFSFVASSDSSLAAITHTGKLDAKLVLMDSLGKEEKVASAQAPFSLDWYSKKCSFAIGKNTVDCALDISQDLKNKAGNLVMSKMPQVQISSDHLANLYRTLSLTDKKNLNLLDHVINENETNRAFEYGLNMPFYACEDCSSTGKEMIVYNVFQSAVTRTHYVKHSLLNGKRLVLKVTLREMKAHPGAFHVIGNNSQGNF